MNPLYPIPQLYMLLQAAAPLARSWLEFVEMMFPPFTFILSQCKLLPASVADHATILLVVQK